jgi:hypothetical protein
LLDGGFSSGASKRTAPSYLAALAVVGCSAIGLSTLGPAADEQPVVRARSREREVHYVTPRQLTDSAALATTAAPALEATTDGDRLFAWPRPDDRRPLLLVFVKKDCPCSVELEPFFHGLERSYGDVVLFAAVMDADVATAKRFSVANATPYPILADPERKLIHRFRAENGAYVVLLVPRGAALVVDSLWPGCSAEMSARLGRRLAVVAGVGERPLDATGLSSALITGCPFDP